MSTQLIVALDFEHEKEAHQLVEHLDPKCIALKIGSEMYTRFGASFVKRLIAKEFKIFLDLKFHDIPTTVARACSASAELGVWMLNVHALGGITMMSAAKKALEVFGEARPLLIAVTILTSSSSQDLASIGVGMTLQDEVKSLAHLAKEAGLDGVVSSALESAMIKSVCGKDFITVTPGIRLPDFAQDDQTRIVTPAHAIKQGSDYLVIGRPITRAGNPSQVVERILKEMKNASTPNQT